MPNFTINEGTVNDICNGVKRLATRRRDFNFRDFPLTTDQIEQATVPAKTLDILRQLEVENVQCISKRSRFNVCLTPDNTPGVNRSAVITVDTPREIFYVKHPYYECGNLIEAVREIPTPYASALEPEMAAKLAVWTNNAVREARLYELVMKTVAQVFKGGHLPTAYHLSTRWPALAMAASDERVQRRQRRRDKCMTLPSLRERLQEKPRSPRAYAWPDGVITPTLAKRMQAVEMVLASAEFIPTDLPKQPVTATIYEWERRPGDAKFD